jgi:pimeloyl-ACP methyl ester carboxylesterase
MSQASTDLPPIAAPSLKLLAMESRALFEAADFILRGPKTRKLPRGDGHPVMIVPGFGTNDRVTAPLRNALEKLGYAAHGWDCGTNLGMRAKVKNALASRLEQLHERYETPVSLIGWSLGGVFVREMARHQSALVRRVITLGSPFNGNPDANNMVTLFKIANRGKPVKPDVDGFLKRKKPPPVPCTSIYTRSDGIVAWPCSLEEKTPFTENIEVPGSHMGLVFNRDVLRVIAERLALPPGD